MWGGFIRTTGIYNVNGLHLRCTCTILVNQADILEIRIHQFTCTFIRRTQQMPCNLSGMISQDKCSVSGDLWLSIFLMHTQSCDIEPSTGQLSYNSCGLLSSSVKDVKNSSFEEPLMGHNATCLYLQMCLNKCSFSCLPCAIQLTNS